MASIGSLTADLKLESAAFIRDLKKAADATARNTGAMQRQMMAVQRSFSAAGAAFKGVVAGFISVAAIKSVQSLANAAVQAGDEIGEAATKLGVGAESLQRLRFAAAQADVDVASLDAALKLFSQNLAQGKIAAEGNNIAAAFQNYIQSIADAPTQLEKVRIAQEAFGKQWQTGLLLAAQGAAEFKEQANSAFVVSAKAVSVASELDNQFRAFSNAVSTGFQTGFLESFADSLGRNRLLMDDARRAGEEFGRIVAGAIQIVTAGVLLSVGAWKELVGVIAQADANIREFYGQPKVLPELPDFESFREQLGLTTPEVDKFNASLGVGVDTAKQAAEAARALKEAQAEQSRIFDETRTPFEAYQLELAKLNELVAKGTIGWDLYSRAVNKVTDDFRMEWMNSMQSAIGQMQGFTGALAQESKTWFRINQAFAIAQAIMSTYEGAAKALGQLGAWGPPVAAGIIATGLAYVAMIASQQPGGSSKGGRGGAARGGGGNGLSDERRRGVGAVGQAVNITLHGQGGFSPEQVMGLIEQINGFVADGVRLNVSQA